MLKSIEDTMLVGHMPFMGLMAQRLLDSSSGPSFNASFETASLVWITKETESELKFVRYINGL
ncbi:MAG: hypothetical protein HOM21_14135 [Halobacteriovoraceae bacterium]|nr:hypothetical protein [Halobacteriovoraceae bacterium]